MFGWGAFSWGLKWTSTENNRRGWAKSAWFPGYKLDNIFLRYWWRGSTSLAKQTRGTRDKSERPPLKSWWVCAFSGVGEHAVFFPDCLSFLNNLFSKCSSLFRLWVHMLEGEEVMVKPIVSKNIGHPKSPLRKWLVSFSMARPWRKLPWAAAWKLIQGGIIYFFFPVSKYTAGEADVKESVCLKQTSLAL